MPGGKLRRVWSWQRWIQHYQHNARTLRPISWERGSEVSAGEMVTFVPSLQFMQQGEGLEGGHFFRCVRRYAEQTGERDYVLAHQLFMAEEKRHAADLERWLESAGVPLLSEQSWLTRLFRWCGSRGGLEQTLVVVLITEVCSPVYYASLRQATGSRVLRQICTQILHDEAFHVRFQCEVLARLRRGRPGWLLALTHLLDSVLFCCAGLVCWWGHRRALRGMGQTFTGFWRRLWLQRHRAWTLKNPAGYAWDGEDERGSVLVSPSRQGEESRRAKEVGA